MCGCPLFANDVDLAATETGHAMEKLILLTFGEILGGHVVDCHLIPLDHVFGVRFAFSDQIIDDARPAFLARRSRNQIVMSD